jgi:hypothetical protein
MASPPQSSSPSPPPPAGARDEPPSAPAEDGGDSDTPDPTEWTLVLGFDLSAGAESSGDNPTGAGVFGHTLVREHSGWFTGTQSLTGALNASTFGFDRKLAGSFSLGAFKPFGEDGREGPFVRLGAEGATIGNREMSLSYLEIPQLRLGGMFVPDPDQGTLELGLHAGPIVGGQFTFDGDAHRKLGPSYEVGPYASWLVGEGAFDLELSATIIVDPPTADRSPVGIVRAMACGLLCLDLWVVHATTTVGNPSTTESSQAAFFGLAFWP